MTSDTIRLFGDPVLRVVAHDVTEFDGELSRLADRLLRALAREEAAGVAAVQIGVERNVFSVDPGVFQSGGVKEVLVNAELVEQDGEVVEEEGCLSFPGIFCNVIRPRWVAIRARDTDGNPVEREATGMLARAYLHEMDHLQGRLIIDRIDPDARERIVAAMQSRRQHAKRGT